MSARLTARDEQRARVLVLSNPPKKGAVDAATLDRIAEEAARATSDGVRALILTGEGGSFCAGYDLATLPAATSAGDISITKGVGGSGVGDTSITELPDAPLGRACAALEACSAPVIAAIDGAAFGAGCELACACDFRLASPAARFSLPPARLGLVYSAEGAWRVMRLVGLSAARRLFLLAPQIAAAHARELGLVDAVVDDPLQAALLQAEELAQLAPLSIAGMKKTLNALARAPLDQETRTQLEELRRAAFASEDAKIGRAAFLARLKPSWTGR